MLARRRLYLVLLAGWVVLTLTLTSIPHPDFHFPFRFADKSAHFLFYGMMGLLCALWRRESGAPVRRAVLEALLFVAATGAIDEVHQRWIPGRSMDVLDWMADVAGGGIGTCLSVVLPRFFPFLMGE